jgi:hypothetical protein
MSIRKNPIAYLALFIALGGSAYAAVSIPSNSIGTSQLRRGAVTAPKLARRAVTSSAIAPGSVGSSALQDAAITATKIAPHSLTAAQFGSGTLPGAGSQQKLETTVAQGALGPSSGPSGPVSVGTTGAVMADCNAGQQAVGGGFQVPADEQSALTITASVPTPLAGTTIPTGWTVDYTVIQPQSTPPLGVKAYAVCATLG